MRFRRSRWTALSFLLAVSAAVTASTAYAHDDEVSLVRLRKVPGTADVTRWLHTAGIARAEGRFGEAAALLDSVAALAPRSAALARCRAQLALDLGQPEAALRALERAGADPRVPWLRAEALARSGRLDDAAAVMDDAIALRGYEQSGQVSARADLARRRSGEGLDGALSHLERGLIRWPGAWDLVARALDLELAAGRPDAALARIDLLLEHAPERVALLVRRGDVLFAAGRAFEAREAWTLALEALERRGVRGAADRAAAIQVRAVLAASPVPLEMR